MRNKVHSTLRMASENIKDIIHELVKKISLPNCKFIPAMLIHSTKKINFLKIVGTLQCRFFLN